MRSRGLASASTSTTTSRLYIVPGDKKQQVSKLKALLKDADELYLATDEDREGEAKWHLQEELKPKVPTKRMVFHEITPEAIARAVANPTELNRAGRRLPDQARPRPATRSPGPVEEGHAAALRRPPWSPPVVARKRDRIAFRLARVLGPRG